MISFEPNVDLWRIVWHKASDGRRAWTCECGGRVAVSVAAYMNDWGEGAEYAGASALMCDRCRKRSVVPDETLEMDNPTLNLTIVLPPRLTSDAE